ncbi:MAG: glycosyltransferase family 4 protein [Candidatus Kapabacteria bacterium]|nr:glycosyltransferase family 4 protein [Candidatus Kapabacteria bacterium]
MKIAYLSNNYDTSNINFKHGWAYYLTRSFKDIGVELVIVPAYEPFYLKLLKIKQRLLKIIFGKNNPWSRITYLQKYEAKKRAKFLKSIDYDACFTFGSISTAYLKIDKPLYFYTDAVFASLLDKYENFSNMSTSYIRQANLSEKMAFDNARRVFLSSNWAAKEAAVIYGVDPKKMVIAEFGANLEKILPHDEIISNIEQKSLDIINFVFIGWDWKRKGALQAIEIVNELRSRGINVKLTFVGCEPEYSKEKYDFVEVTGYLKKDSEEGALRFNSILLKSHFFIMLSKYETFGQVYCEANAFGIPCIGADVLGVSTVIKDGVNGLLINPDDEIEKIVERIFELIIDKEKYITLCKSSLNKYETRLNWNTCAQTIYRTIIETKDEA